MCTSEATVRSNTLNGEHQQRGYHSCSTHANPSPPQEPSLVSLADAAITPQRTLNNPLEEGVNRDAARQHTKMPHPKIYTPTIYVSVFCLYIYTAFHIDCLTSCCLGWSLEALRYLFCAYMTQKHPK